MNLTEYFCEEYLTKIFYYCLKKTKNESDADDLAGNIGLEVISALKGGTKVENFNAWVWTIARNCYAKWAKKKYYSFDSDTISIDENLNEMPSENCIEDEIVLSEDLKSLRRELAFIRSDYRQILVAHYFEEKSVSTIAKELSIPVGTVKTKLQNSRKKLKEGIYMAREFGKRSFKPEEISFVNNCSSFGDRGQPWSILEHLMYKNIFLEVYENPETAEELSLEMGIALPYMESELDFLVRETFLVKEGNKYKTAFPIVDRVTQIERYNIKESFADKVTPSVISLADRFNELCEKYGVKYYGGGQPYDVAKWTLIPLYVHKFTRAAEAKFETVKMPHTERPDNGCWDIVGYEHTELPERMFVGLHTMDFGGKRLENCFGQYKYHYRDMASRTPNFLTPEETKTLYNVAFGKYTDSNIGLLETLESYGYITRKDGKYTASVVLIDEDAVSEIVSSFSDAEKDEIREMASHIVDVFAEYREKSGDYTFTLCERICERAIDSGVLKYSENLPKYVGAYIYK